MESYEELKREYSKMLDEDFRNIDRQDEIREELNKLKSRNEKGSDKWIKLKKELKKLRTRDISKEERENEIIRLMREIEYTSETSSEEDSYEIVVRKCNSYYDKALIAIKDKDISRLDHLMSKILKLQYDYNYFKRMIRVAIQSDNEDVIKCILYSFDHVNPYHIAPSEHLKCLIDDILLLTSFGTNGKDKLFKCTMECAKKNNIKVELHYIHLGRAMSSKNEDFINFILDHKDFKLYGKRRRYRCDVEDLEGLQIFNEATKISPTITKKVLNIIKEIDTYLYNKIISEQV